MRIVTRTFIYGYCSQLAFTLRDKRHCFLRQIGRLVVISVIDTLTLGQRFKQDNESVILAGGSSQNSLLGASKYLSGNVRYQHSPIR